MELNKRGKEFFGEMLLRDIESKPCACGKRKHAIPQHPINEIVVEKNEHNKPFYKYSAPYSVPVICEQDFCCGVCKQTHGAFMEQTIPTGLMKTFIEKEKNNV